MSLGERGGGEGVKTVKTDPLGERGETKRFSGFSRVAQTPSFVYASPSIGRRARERGDADLQDEVCATRDFMRRFHRFLPGPLRNLRNLWTIRQFGQRVSPWTK